MRTLRSVAVACLSISIFLYLNSIPDTDKPHFYLTFLNYVRSRLAVEEGSLEVAFQKRLRDVLEKQYSYLLAPHRALYILNPPLSIDWSVGRPAEFYDYANAMPLRSGPYYNRSTAEVYKAYGYFLESIDLSRILNRDGDLWLPVVKKLKVYRELVAKEKGDRSGNARKMALDIESLLATADGRTASIDKKRYGHAVSLYTTAVRNYLNLGNQINVTDSETSHLRPSYILSPPFSKWVDSVAAVSSGPITGSTVIEIKDSHANGRAASVDAASGSAPVTVEGTGTATLDIKRVGKMDIQPGGWFSESVVEFFSKGPFFSGVKPGSVIGRDGVFASMPVALIVIQEPRASFDIVGLEQDQLKGALATIVGPLSFTRADATIVTDRSSTRLVTNPRQVYLVGVVAAEMPYVR